LHVFTYSERANTHALSLKDKVSQKTRNERTTQLRSLSEKKRHYFYEQQLGSVAHVLFEKEEHGDEMFGFTENYVKVSAKYDPLRVNEIVKVNLMNFDDAGETIEVSEVVAEVLHH
ncbi:MAG: tRNA (N(6)-L-threonylcarbamoyladenosine(37)-C(2))-methylthiotransferase MtaB, partial [Cytophagales bacterium]